MRRSSNSNFPDRLIRAEFHPRYDRLVAREAYRRRVMVDHASRAHPDA